MTQRVFVDANILMSKTLRDWLYFLREGTGQAFQLHTTEDVFEEAFYHLRKKNARLPGHVMQQWRQQIRGALIQEFVSAFPSDVPFSGADQEDFHVHAAALHGRADILLSNNAPEDFSLDSTPYEVMNADAFLCLAAASVPPTRLRHIVQEQIAYWSTKPGHRQVDEALIRAGCPNFAQQVRAVIQRLALG